MHIRVRPAAALAAYLSQVGWELTSNATLLGPGGLRLNLRMHSSCQIKDQLKIAWDWFCHKQTQHRKGIQAQLFDFLTTRRLINKFTDRQRRILALTMTAGWQANAGIAQWSAAHDPKCKWCETPDTHSHQYLECSAFQNIRDQHSTAVTSLRRWPELCYFPLPVHAEEVELVRQALHIRNHTHW